MGVSIVFESPQTMEQIESNLSIAGAEDIGAFNIECHQLVASDTVKKSDGNNFLSGCSIIHHHDYPENTFIFMEGMKGTTLKVSSMRGIDGILAKYESNLEHNKEGLCCVAGRQWKLGDTIVRFGIATLANSVHGTIVEVEVTSCSVVAMCRTFFYECVNDLFPNEFKECKKPDVLTKRTSNLEKWTPAHTMAMYNDIFDGIRQSFVI